MRMWLHAAVNTIKGNKLLQWVLTKFQQISGDKHSKRLKDQLSDSYQSAGQIQLLLLMVLQALLQEKRHQGHL